MAGKIEKVLHEFKTGSLKSSSGQKVRKRKQAIAIALSEARQAGEHVPKRSMMRHPKGTMDTFKRGYK